MRLSHARRRVQAARSIVVAALAALLFAGEGAAAVPTGDEWVESAYVLDFATLVEFTTTGDLDVRRVTLDGQRFEADDVRAAYATIRAQQGEEAAARFVERFEDAFADALVHNLRAAFPGAKIEPATADVAEASLEAPHGGSATEPPVEVRVTAETTIDVEEYGYGDFETEDVAALLAAGAEIDVPIELFADPGHRNDFRIRFPAEVEADGGVAEVRQTVDNLDGRAQKGETRQVTLSTAAGGLPEESAGTVEVLLDIHDVDVTLAGAAAGDFGAMLVDVTVAARFDAVELPADVATSLPPGVRLDVLGSDGVRALVSRGLVTEADLGRAAGELTSIVGEGLAGALGSPPRDVRGAWVAGTFAPGSAGAVAFEATASVVRPIGADAEPQRGAAVSIYTIPTSLAFSKFAGFDTVYRIVLPPGLAVEGAEGEGVTSGTREDGREEIVVSMVGEDAPEATTMSAGIAVTPSFVAAKFWPVVLVAALVVVGVVFLAVRALFRR